VLGADAIAAIRHRTDGLVAELDAWEDVGAATALE
jgi:hypothetical protein